MSIKGIDVSKAQGVINWTKVKGAGIDFAMIRAGAGNNNVDEQFIRNATVCNQLNIPIGVYWFSYAYTVEMAKKEAGFCIDAIKKHKITYPVCYDFEYDSVNFAKKQGVTVQKDLATKMAGAFCQKIKAAGYIPMNYANLDYMENMFGNLPFEIWYARYSETHGKDNITMWQYSSNGKLSGINGNVDMNICYKDFSKSQTVKPSTVSK